jgi:hypothetical protein
VEVSVGASERCYSREEILRFLEGEPLGGGLPAEAAIASHLDACEACALVRERLLAEWSGVEHSLSLLWKRERISCPHRDILASFVHGSLPAAQVDYVRFHLDVIGCGVCQANVRDLREEDREEEPALRKVRDEVLRSTTAFLKKRR